MSHVDLQKFLTSKRIDHENKTATLTMADLIERIKAANDKMVAAVNLQILSNKTFRAHRHQGMAEGSLQPLASSGDVTLTLTIFEENHGKYVDPNPPLPHLLLDQHLPQMVDGEDVAAREVALAEEEAEVVEMAVEPAS